MPAKMPSFSGVSFSARRSSSLHIFSKKSFPSPLACQPASSQLFARSAETATKVAPKSVSGRVVKTLTLCVPSFCPGMPESGNSNFAPSERPIQFLCDSLIDSGQFNASKSERRRSAYSRIFKTHWRSGFFSTSEPHRSHLPPSRSSSASPVLHDGHQLMGSCDSYASPFLKSWRKIHCVHLYKAGSEVLTSRSQSTE